MGEREELSEFDVKISPRWLRWLKRSAHGVLALFGYEVCRDPHLRLRRRMMLGDDILVDIVKILGRPPRLVIDGGAHVGETAIGFSEAFPHVRVLSFEPSPSSFEQLCRNTRSNPNIKAVRAALGERTETAPLHQSGDSQINSLLELSEEAFRRLSAERTEARESVYVQVYALDDFVPEQVAEPIDLLKLDVQGYELSVLRGSRRLLDRAAFPLLYLEICYASYYRNQTTFPELYGFLYERGYRLVSIYPSEFDAHRVKYREGGDLLFVHESFASDATSGEGRPSELDRKS